MALFSLFESVFRPEATNTLQELSFSERILILNPRIRDIVSTNQNLMMLIAIHCHLIAKTCNIFLFSEHPIVSPYLAILLSLMDHLIQTKLIFGKHAGWRDSGKICKVLF